MTREIDLSTKCERCSGNGIIECYPGHSSFLLDRKIWVTYCYICEGTGKIPPVFEKVELEEK